MRGVSPPVHPEGMESVNPLLELSKQLADAVEIGERAVVAVHGRPRVPSSGVLWRTGVVVTSDQTLQRDEDITVTLPGGRNLPATLAGRDGGTDLAVLRLSDDGSGADHAAKTVSEASIKAGNLVLALGRRGGEGVTASFGVLSAIGGPWRTWRGGRVERFIRPDVNIYPGFSGGALVDVEGRVIGLNTSGLTRGTGVTLPASTLSRVTEELLSRGHVRRGFLGVGLHPVQLPDGSSGLVVLSRTGWARPAGRNFCRGCSVDARWRSGGRYRRGAIAPWRGPDRQNSYRRNTARRIADPDRHCAGGTPCPGEVTMPGLEEVIERLRRSTVQVLSGRGGGSGVIWDANGSVVTNAHVVRGKYAEIVDVQGRRGTARIIRRDRARDLAVLQIAPANLEPAEIGDSASLRIGQLVLAIGHPFGVAGAVTLGTIHAAGEGSKWIQADVRLAPGNSGGILADAAGRVIGINTMIFHGIGLAVPSNEVNRFLHADSARARAA